MHHVLHAEPALPSRLDPGIAHAFDAVVARSLAKRPQDRFQSANEFSVALLAAFRGRPAAEAVPPADLRSDRTLSPQQSARYEHTGTLGAAKQLEPLSTTLPAQTLAEIEASLTRAIGPLAKQLVKRGAAQSRSIDEFYAVLADNLPQGREREAFLTRIRRLDIGASGASGPLPATSAQASASAARVATTPTKAFDPAMLAHCEKHLARHVGPLARVLIKRASSDSGNVAELVRKLAEHIDDEGDRQTFIDGVG